MSVRITDVREVTKPIASPIRNAYIDFSKMTTSLLDATGENLDPDRVWSTLMMNEKPGGHGERSVAVGTIDMAVWDAVAKIAGKPLFRLLAERHGVRAN